MVDIPPYIGRPTIGDEVYALICAYTGPTPEGPICGRPGIAHHLFRNAAGDQFSVITCIEHATMPPVLGAVDEHPTVGSACCLPGAVWVDGPPSKCELDDSAPEPHMAARRLVPVGDRR